ncbi:MAG: GatB/YqeY domain-containing protein [Candidatus Zambryskibacteria bacterium]|nr:GatB/YqeY domain-containing protein [Candidatus Zambryskibacteria bacterium]
MTLQIDIKTKMVEAMRAKDAVKLQTLRGILSAFTNELVNLKRTPQDMLSDEEALAVIRRAVKQRKDSIEQFVSGGRPELAEDEKAELAVLETYLPAMMSEEDIMKIALAKKEEMGEVDKSKAGQFVGMLMKDLKGKADGDVVKKVVDSILA